jgi:HAD superfamily hydrolase (TIGR01509 family)
VVFDMDGVITDSEPLYGEAITSVIAREGHHLSDADHAAIMGSGFDYSVDWVRARFGLRMDRQAFVAAYDEAITRLLKDHAEPADGLLGLLDQLAALGMKIGLASSAKQRWVEAVLGRLGVRGRFQSLAWGEMAVQAKPAPDLYLLAARGLGIPPEQCIAVEDTPRGIQAGLAAGMRVVAVRTAATAGLDVSQAHLVVDSLRDFPFAWLRPD